MKLKDSILLFFLFSGAICICSADKDDDDDDHDDQNDKDDDEDGQPNYCPEANGMFPNPTDCSTFYNCVDGTAIAMSCAPGLLFDPEKKMCNFPNQVKCSNECRGPNGLFPSQHRCDEFILCTNNKPKVQRCKKGLYFDANLQVCNYKGQVLCSLPGGGSKGNKTTGNKNDKNKKNKKNSNKSNKNNKNKSDDDDDDDDGYSMRNADTSRGHKELAKASVRSVCPKSRGLFAHHDACNMFYQCYDGEVLIKSCPKGLLFDEHEHVCAFGKEVNCGQRKVYRIIDES